eukprot:TRINITY_DN730_c1_g1_i6.p1 TRINITY_DN730_c1_g1~~TRINITY_DN730_c1_g1_i6.p1  ORF type:complete len:4200 (+),score=1431.71 TRINITY_DN730_c1_g1_i6:1002-12602(+)
MFLAEDPFRFARRVASAHAGRQEAEALLRYNLYVDSMPTDEIPPLDSTQIKRIMSSALNVKRLKGKRLDTSMLVKEINKDYARTMNKIIFDMNYKDPNQADLFDSLALPPLPEDEDVPEFGTVRIPDHNFPEQFSEFTFHSFLTKPEVINAIVKVRGECNRIQSLNLFNTFFTKSVRMDEFEQMQYQANHQVVNNLKESWVTTLKNAIKNSLRAVGKGWFNLHERNKEVYDISKLKKFMVMINFMMQDSLRFLVESNLEAYASFMENAALGTTVVKSPSEVNQEFESDQQRYSARKNPLFLVDLLVKDNEFTFSTPIDVCEDAPLAIFDKVLTSLQDIPQLEPQVMEDLFWAHKPMLAAVHRGEDHVEGVRSRIQEALLSCLRPLQEYMHTFDEYVEFAKLDPAEYVKQFEDGKQTIVQLKQEVNHHLSERRRIETTIPVSISIGMFTVNCLQLRNFLADKRAQLAKLVLEALAKRARAVSDKIHGEFQKVFIELQKRPDCIEELVSLREYMAKIPAETADCAGWIKEMGVYYDVLEDFKFPLVPEDFNQKWVSYGWPRKISERIEEVDRLLEHDKSRFQTDLIRDKETFFIELEEFQRVISGFSRHTNLQKVATVAEEVARLQSQLNNAQAKSKKYNSRDVLFGFEVTEFEDLEKVQKMFEPYYNLWTTANNWLKWREEWMKGPFHTLDYEQMDSDLSNAWKVMYKAVKFFQDKGPGQYEIATELKQQMDDFKPHMPMVTALRNPGMRDRHWIKIREETELDLAPTDDQTLETLLKLNLAPHMEEISKVAQVAGKEFAIEQALDKMEGEWADISFEILEYRKTGTYVVKGSDDIIQLLDDHIAMTQSMSFSAFKKPFEERIGKWEVKLQLISDIIDEWLACQRNWLYLEPIFSSDDINRQMPTEGKRFSTVDRMWRKVMGNAAKNPSVMAVTSIDKVLDTFQECNKLLDLIQKGLSDYLETKRTSFPRFYFLSNDELLEILSQTKDPKAVQPHLRKCFEAIASIKFEEDLKMSSMTSMEKEVVEFCEPLYPKGNVENWLLEVERVMRKSLRLILKDATSVYKKTKRTEWVTMWPGQVVIAGSQVHWTQEVETALRKAGAAGLERLYKKLCGQLDDLTALIRGGKLTRMERMTLGSLIVIDVHARDVVDRMVQGGVNDIREFEWISQLRYYMDGDQVLVKMVNTNFNYGYEYLGNTGRLVITPLTDRCYITLTGALHLQLGGAPAGPAGTGKTETTKDLAKALAKQCVVFNCSDGLDYLAMGKFFKGLASAGAWACFDEFNRIDLEVLSVIAQQIISIQKAIQQKVKRFMFEGVEIALDPTCAVFITMNPGYAGRTELPDNLKALFRPVTMVVPDLEQICEIMLFSEGFNSAKQLAKKMTVLYKLAKEQLSKQYHYDFGLRALKSVLVMAGALKRGSPDLQEDVVLMRALRDMNAPKFVFEDVPLFLGLIGDLFPGLDCPRVRYPNLNDAIEKTLEDAGYQALPQQADKVVQLYETMLTRHTTMVVGPTGGGKSVVIETLATAQTSLGLTTKRFTINPKAQTVLELYGVLDPNTRDWTDGLLSNIFREVNRPLPPDKKEKRLIVFDGDVDAVWVENMNSVMDDNRILTLPNGERILLAKHCNLLFEVADLQYASPATVSRCGMVYVDPKNLGFDPYFQTWASRRSNKQEAEHLRNLFAKYGAPCVDLIINGAIGDDLQDPLATIIPMSGLNMTRQLCNLFECISDDKSITDMQVLEAVFIFCVMWSFGGGLVDADREKFDAFIKKKSELAVIDSAEIPCGPGQLPGALPTIYEYYFDVENFRWRPWADLVTPFVPPEDHKFSKILVPTVDTVRYNWILNTLARRQQAVLFVGDSGNAKTVIIQDYLRKLSREEFITLNVNFSSRTTSMDMQRTLEDNVDKITKDTYGPPANKKLVVFVDDINMPRVDIYGTQQPIALLKLVVERKGMYDRGKDLKWKNLLDVQFIAAMGPPGGGRNAVDPRFVSLFNMFNISSPSQDSLYRIYDSILEAHLDSFSGEVKNAGSVITKITLELYEKIVQTLPPTPTKFHYIFNLRDLSRVYEGLWQVTPDIFDSEAKFVRLWRNECLRVFHDRLTNDTDRKHVQECIEELVKENFPETVEHVMQNPILFGDWRNCNNEDLRLYEDLGDYNDVRPVTEEALENYNYKNKAMNLVMFDDALAHLARIERILRLGRGNALLVGVGGSGKQSLTKLAAFMAGYKTFSITLARNYGETEFREDLKSLYTMLGAEGEKVVFLFTDAHVADEGFLENINNMLTSGVVPALFDESEKDGLINSVREEVKKAGLYDTKETCWSWFIDKCRDNLRIVLCMSPVGDLLRRRCRNFPGLVSNTVIDWYEAWPEQALKSVAEVFLEHEDLPDDCRQGIVEHMVMVHLDVTHKSREYEQTMRRYNYVTPKNFLDYISNYKTSLNENRKKFTKMTNRFAGGLEKLVQASEEVDTMSVQLAESKIIVEQKKKENDILLVKIDEATKQATEKQVVATQREEELVELNKQISIDRADAEQALEEALPALQAAKDALKNLNKSDLTEVRSFAKPPIMVEKVVECVSILKGIKELNWKLSKTMMAAPDFINSLIHFDTNKLTEKQVRSVKEYFKISKFTPSELTSVSRAAAGLLTWVYAMVNFYGVYKTVAPKRQAVANLEKQMAKGEKDLADVKEEVRQLNQELEDLGKQFEQSTKEATELSEKAALMEKRMAAAKRLIAGLGTEKIRWAAEVEELKEKRKKLVGDCLLSSSFLSYLGAFNQTFRQQMLYDTWEKDVDEKNVPKTGKYRVEELLADEVVLSTWASDGLPGDELSVQNGILTTYASRYPLCIDPQLQAINWIKKKESKNNLKVATFNDPDFLKHLELCISYGQPFLFENLDEYIDPIIDSVLERNLQSVGNRKFIVLGDKEVDWDDSFRLFMTTKLQNPHYSPEVFGKTSIINYSVTQQGLSDQLLNVVVGHERADLEKERSALIQSMSDNRVTLKGLEDTLLSELSDSTGLILDNTELIETLEDTKTKATEVSDKIEQAAQTAKELDAVRGGYRPAAKRGSILFFVLSGLSAIDSMYEYALGSYLELFELSLRKSKMEPQLVKRLHNIITTLTYNVYTYGCTGLFEKHKLMFSLQMTLAIIDGENELDHTELDFFLKGNIALEKGERKCPYSWIPAQGWEDLQRLITINEKFENIVTDVEQNEGPWKAWYDLEAPEQTALPQDYDEKLENSSFRKLCVLKCFRPDRVFLAVKQFVIDKMGTKFVEPPVINYENIFEQSSPFSPLVFILSPGADPASNINALAEKLGFGGNKLKMASLGQGQGPIAEAHLETGATRGQWVVLQNCHLLTRWLKTLEKILETIEKPHKDFRLWLTTEPTPEFPMGILQRSMKVVTEPPNGLRLNMRSTYAKITEETLSQCTHTAFRPLVYVLAFFHAVVQERRKYGKVGWNVPYDFNDSDFRVSMLVLSTYLTKAQENKDAFIPWESLKYLIGEAMYGGRVSDAWDRRILNTYLNEYMGDFLFDTFQPFHFYQAEGMDYKVPPAGTRDEYAEAVENLPLLETPGVFGLHSNAEISYLTNSTKTLWRDLIDLQPRTTGSATGVSREDFIGQVAKDIKGKLPNDFDLQMIKKNIGVPSPTQIVLLQELDRFSRLLTLMATTLSDLQKALVGEIGMSNELDDIANSIFIGELPASWRRLAPMTQKSLGNWLEHFHRRHEQYANWVNNGEPAVVWLAGLHIPEAYLTALVQSTCRARGWPLDRSTLYTKVTKYTNPKQVTTKLPSGCFVSGLYLEGAGWDHGNSRLKPQEPKQLVVDLPILQIIPIEASKLKLQNTFKTPVYVTQQRMDAMGVGLVFEADIPVADHASHSVLQGVALVLNTD